MATDMPKAKGDQQPLGISWIQKFLARHPQIISKYKPPLDKERDFSYHGQDAKPLTANIPPIVVRFLPT